MLQPRATSESSTTLYQLHHNIEPLRRSFRAAFALVDSDHSGRLEASELIAAFGTLTTLIKHHVTGSADTASADHPVSASVGSFSEAEPPQLCKGSENSSHQPRYPGLNFCPAPDVAYMRQHHANIVSGRPLPPDMLWLDAMFILELIGTVAALSKQLVNLGAAPSSAGEDNLRKPIPGDDTTALNHLGWSSLNIDAPENALSVKQFYSIYEHATTEVSGELTPANIDSYLHEHHIGIDIDLLKLDIDSFECDYLEAILHAGFRPKVIDIECASSYPPPIKFRAFHSESASWDSLSATPFGGCSLQEACDILKPFNYSILQYPLEDGWFVQKEYIGLFGPLEQDLATLFYLGNPHLYGAWQVFEGTHTLLHAFASKASGSVLLEEIEKVHEEILSSRPELRSVVNYSLSIAPT